MAIKFRVGSGPEWKLELSPSHLISTGQSSVIQTRRSGSNKVPTKHNKLYHLILKLWFLSASIISTPFDWSQASAFAHWFFCSSVSRSFGNFSPSPPPQSFALNSRVLFAEFVAHHSGCFNDSLEIIDSFVRN